MASIRKRESKWQVQVRRQGYPPFSKTFHEKSDALKWARLTESNLDKGIIPRAALHSDLTTLRDVLQHYLKTVTPLKRGKAQETYLIGKLIRDPISDAAIKSLSPDPFSEYRDRRLRGAKPETVRKELTLLQRALNIAIREWGLRLSTNPLLSVRKPPSGKPRDRRLSPEEIETLLTATAQCRNTLMKPLILFAIETGMRLGELLSLKWEDVDQAKSLAVLHQTKNGWPRTIPLSRRAVAILNELPSKDAEKVFPTTSSAVKQSWKRLVRRAELKDLHFHDLRHEAISRLFEKGLNVPQVALISGHRDIRQLQRYTHLRAEDLVAKLD